MNSKQTFGGTAFELFGQAGNPVVTCIHGLGLCRELWLPFLSFWEHDFQILTYDLPGHGQSAPSQIAGSLKVYAKQVLDLLDYLNIKETALLGFSLGGMINRRFAVDYPHRVSKLVILNAPHQRGEPVQKEVEERARQVGRKGPLVTLEAALARWFTPAYLSAGGNWVDAVSQWRRQLHPESYHEAALVLAHGVRELIKPSPPIEKPALIMTCENDRSCTPAMSLDIASEIVNSQTHILDDLQHLGLLERPDLFAVPIRDFLSRS